MQPSRPEDDGDRPDAVSVMADFAQQLLTATGRGGPAFAPLVSVYRELLDEAAAAGDPAGLTTAASPVSSCRP